MATTTTTRLRVQPAIASRVLHLLVGHDSSGLTELVEADPSLCAVVVRAANSTHLGLSRRVGGVRQAMVLLGQDATKALAVARTADLVFEDDAQGGLPPSWFWPHAVATAIACSGLARAVDVNPEHAYTAGLLHDVAVLFDDRHDADHPERAAAALEGWNFPDQIVTAIRSHHRQLDEVIAPMDRLLVAGRSLASEAGLTDGRTVAPLRDVQRVLDVSRSDVKAVLADIERGLARLVRLAGAK
jgi:putative nucleotidyltransferase with HDIG domain